LKYDFDVITDRKGTDCLKWDFSKERGIPEDALPMWVADMDFKTPECVQTALKKVVEHGIFGYTNTKEEFARVVCDWFLRNHSYAFSPEWLVKTPGVVFALATAVKAFCEPGDGVVIQQPVYYPFFSVIRNNKRRIVNNPLIYRDGRYEMDYEDLEQKVSGDDVKLFILCSPHNPVGRVWTKEELTKVWDICSRHGVIVVSDEIHCDFTYPGYVHTVFASLSDEAADNCVILTAPSKSFNLAGLQYSSIFIKNVQLRRKFEAAVYATGYDEPSVMGVTAARAAYSGGQEWLDQLRVYLADNLAFMKKYLRDNMPDAGLVEPEGTYLVWVDCRGLGLTDEELNDAIVNKARLWLDAGRIFGDEGKGFQRFNLACPRDTLEEALKRFCKIV